MSGCQGDDKYYSINMIKTGICVFSSFRLTSPFSTKKSKEEEEEGRFGHPSVTSYIQGVKWLSGL